MCNVRETWSLIAYSYIDYKYLNSAGTKPRFAFGHGLSYTNFTYTNATITKVTQLTSTPPRRQHSYEPSFEG